MDFLEDNGLRFGGDLGIGPSGELRLTGPQGRDSGADFYAVSISDPFQNLDLWAKELRTLIQYVRTQNSSPRVVLLCASAGGVAARKYLIDWPNDHGVETLITLGSPHLGTEIALLGHVLWRTLSDEGPLPEGLRARLRAGAEALQSSTGMRIDSPILEQLAPEELSDWLRALNRTPHPPDVRYVMVLVETEPGSRLLGRLAEEIRRAAEEPGHSALVAAAVGVLLAFINEHGWFSSDGIVLRERQRLDRVAGLVGEQFEIETRSVFSRTHADAKGRHWVLLQALDTRPVVVEAMRVGTRGDSVELRFEHPLPRMVQLWIGDETPVVHDPPLVFRGKENTFARVRLPITKDAEDALTVFARGPGERTIYATRVLTSGAARSQAVPAETDPVDSLLVRVNRITGVPLLKPNSMPWDLGIPGVGRSWPDLRLAFAVDGRTTSWSERVERDWRDRDLPAAFEFLWTEGSGGSSIGIELWDEDEPDPDDLMGTIDWPATMMRDGTRQLKALGGWSVELEFTWLTPATVRYAAEPLMLKGSR